MRKVLLFLSLFAAVAVHAQQLADTTAVNQYINDNIRDKRPDKVTADQLRQALLGVSSMTGKYNLLNTNLRNNTGAARTANLANQNFMFDSAAVFGINFKSYLSNTALAQWALVPAGMILTMPGTNASSYVFGPNFSASHLDSYSLGFGGSTNLSMTTSAFNVAGVTNFSVTTPGAHLYVGSDYAQLGNNASYLYVSQYGIRMPLLANSDTNKVLTAGPSGELRFKTLYPSSGGGGSAGFAANGVRLDVDTVKLGGVLSDELTELHVPSYHALQITGANDVDTMALSISQSGGTEIQLSIHDTATAGNIANGSIHLNKEDFGGSFGKLVIDGQGNSTEDEYNSNFFMQAQYAGSQFQKNKIVQVGEDFRSVRQYENTVSQNVDEFAVQTKQINPGFGDLPYRKNRMVLDSTGFRVDSANSDGVSEGEISPIGSVFKVNTYDASVELGGYRNNEAEDSVLTTDENGRLKLKYFSGGGGASTASNGLHVDGGVIKLGGNIDEPTSIKIADGSSFEIIDSTSTDVSSYGIYTSDGRTKYAASIGDTVTVNGINNYMSSEIRSDQVKYDLYTSTSDENGSTADDDRTASFYLSTYGLINSIERDKFLGIINTSLPRYLSKVSQNSDSVRVSFQQLVNGSGYGRNRLSGFTMDSATFHIDTLSGSNLERTFEVNTSGVVSAKQVLSPAQYVKVKKGITVNTTIDTTATHWKFDCTSSDIVVTLPSASAALSWVSTGSGKGYGVKYFIQKSDNSSHVLTINANTGLGQSIDGQATFQLYNANSFITIYSDGENWYSN